MKKRPAVLCCLLGVVLFHLSLSVLAQNNSWTNSVSGKWEDAPSWSLGVPPGTNNQGAVVFTNEGIKTVTIDSNTVQNFSDTLTVGFITISAPTNSFNTLVVSNAELTSLANIRMGSNSAVELYSSSFQAEGFFLGGNFIANDSQILPASWGDDFYLGDYAPGVFSMTNSFLSVWNEYLGGSFPATFNQQGGTNSTRYIYLQNSGVYNFYGGDFGTPTNAPTIYFQDDSVFNQFGGTISALLVWLNDIGGYHLAGGYFSCSNLDIPYDPNNQGGLWYKAYFWQSGGTNVSGQIALGTSAGSGSYSLSGGVLVSSGLVLQDFWGVNPGAGPVGSFFSQSGGFHTNGGVQISGSEDQYYDVSPSVYALSNGILETPSLGLGMGDFDQSGGTNLANSVSLDYASVYSLSGGFLFAQNINMTGSGPPTPYYRIRPTSVQQSGGTNLVSGTLSLANFANYQMSDGQLVAQNLSLSSSDFYHYGGTVNVQGLLELTNGNWYEQTGGGELGQLQLGGGTNSLFLSSTPCLLRFADSSDVLWSNAAVLVISNWSGSLYGGGNQQIIFGSNAAALTAQQLGQIQFRNPVGLAVGNYPARILATGEIVPDSGAPPPPKMTIECFSTNSAMQLTLGGDIGKSYDIEVSTDMVNWLWWTNQFNSNGTIYLNDWEATNYPQRYYRARATP